MTRVCRQVCLQHCFHAEREQPPPTRCVSTLVRGPRRDVREVVVLRILKLRIKFECFAQCAVGAATGTFGLISRGHVCLYEVYPRRHASLTLFTSIYDRFFLFSTQRGKGQDINWTLSLFSEGVPMTAHNGAGNVWVTFAYPASSRTSVASSRAYKSINASSIRRAARICGARSCRLLLIN